MCALNKIFRKNKKLSESFYLCRIAEQRHVYPIFYNWIVCGFLLFISISYAEIGKKVISKWFTVTFQLNLSGLISLTRFFLFCVSNFIGLTRQEYVFFNFADLMFGINCIQFFVRILKKAKWKETWKNSFRQVKIVFSSW